MSCLWMGNLEPYMDEKFITRAFATMGELVVGVRIIRNKGTWGVQSNEHSEWGAAGYCFVELADEATAERCLRKINGKPVPGATPPKRFKLNRATYGKQGETRLAYPDNRYAQAYPYSQNQYYQQYSNYYSGWGYDQSYGYNYGQYDYSTQAYDETQDDGLEDPNVEVDVVEANRQFMEESEELYDALMDCHWPFQEPTDSPEYADSY